MTQRNVVHLGFQGKRCFLHWILGNGFRCLLHRIFEESFNLRMKVFKEKIKWFNFDKG